MALVTTAEDVDMTIQISQIDWIRGSYSESMNGNELSDSA